MAYYEYPHTENYDQDLGWLIDQYTVLLTNEDAINKEIDNLDARVKYLETNGGGDVPPDIEKELKAIKASVDALTIVVNNNKKLTDQEIANTNKKVTTLETKLNGALTRLTSVENDITNIKNVNNTQDASISDLKKTTDTHTNEIASIKAKNNAQDEAITTINTDIKSIETKNIEQDTALEGMYEAIYRFSDDYNIALGGKQETLVSSQNIKTINGNSLLGAGDLAIEGGGGGGGTSVVFGAPVAGSVVPGRIYINTIDSRDVAVGIGLNANDVIPLIIFDPFRLGVDQQTMYVSDGGTGNLIYYFSGSYDSAIQIGATKNNTTGYIKLGRSILNSSGQWWISSEMVIGEKVSFSKDVIGKFIINAVGSDPIPATSAHPYQLYWFGEGHSSKLYFSDGNNWYSMPVTRETNII